MTLSRWRCLLLFPYQLHVIKPTVLLKKVGDRARPLWCGLFVTGEGDCHGPAVICFTLLWLPCQELANLVKREKNFEQGSRDRVSRLPLWTLLMPVWIFKEKEITISNYVCLLLVLPQCDVCIPAWRFCTT